MDTDRLIELAERFEALREMERDFRHEVDPNEQRELGKTLKAMQKQVATLQRSVLSTYNHNFLNCRDIGHVWDVEEQVVDNEGLSRVLVCPRCETKRTESFSRLGDLTNRSYNHPDEYLLPSSIRGTQQWTKSFWRGIQYQVAQQEAV